MKILKYKFEINKLNPKNIEYKKIDNKKINFINVPLNNKFLRKYLDKSFEIALRLHKDNNKVNIINGPINKKKFLQQKFLGVTEYLGSKTNNKRKYCDVNI